MLKNSHILGKYVPKHFRRKLRIQCSSLIQCSFYCATTSKSNATDSAHSFHAITQKNNNNALFATTVGAGVNLVLASTKGFLGYAVGSTALIADSFNSLGDLFSDAVVYYTVSAARQGTSPEKPWGSGKLEPLGAFVVGGLLGFTGLGIAYTAGVSILDSLQILSHAKVILPDISPGLIDPEIVEKIDWKHLDPAQYGALGISAVSVVVKEMLFRYTLAIGNKANSNAVIANAWQHRSDALVSGAVLAGLSGSYLGYGILDPIAGLFVSGVILKQAVSIGHKSLKDLADAPATKEETQALRATCLRVPGIQSVVDLKARQSGPYLFVECTVGVHGQISASAGHRLAELVRAELMKRHRGRVANAVVDVDPLGSTGLGELASHDIRSHEDITVEVKRALLEPWRSDVTWNLLKIRDEEEGEHTHQYHKSLSVDDNTSSSGTSVNSHVIALDSIDNTLTSSSTINDTIAESFPTTTSSESSQIVTPTTATATATINESTVTSSTSTSTPTATINESTIISSTSTSTPTTNNDDSNTNQSVEVITEDRLNLSDLIHIQSVSEVIVYYKDDGGISLKVDVCMNPDLTIRKAHQIAVLARLHLMRQIKGLSQVDVDLELDDQGGHEVKLKTKS